MAKFDGPEFTHLHGPDEMLTPSLIFICPACAYRARNCAHLNRENQIGHFTGEATQRCLDCGLTLIGYDEDEDEE